jgi:polyhydroxyalkanoate synthase subunit PhaC
MSEDVLAHSHAGAGFEAVLANVALRGIGALTPPRTDIGRLARALVRRPKPAARRIAGLAARLAHVGTSVDDKPGDRDRRFADRAWAGNPALQRLALSYLATCDAVTSVLDEADLDWRTRERLRIPIDNLLAAVAPTNALLLSPASWKECIDTGGGSLVSGLNNLVSDLRSPDKLATSVDRSAFRLGENVAATPGKVVRRTRNLRADRVRAANRHRRCGAGRDGSVAGQQVLPAGSRPP